MFLLNRSFLKKYKFLAFFRIFFNPFFLFSPILAFKKLIYNPKKDLDRNTELLIDLELDIEKIKLQLKDLNLDYYTYHHLSWHYHLFAGLSQKFKKIRILEIGTYSGDFTSFLSSIFPDSEIITCDLAEDNNQFINSYDRDDANIKKTFLEKRKINLNKKNIKFLELDSISLLEHFEKNSFDLIWIDGDHLNPQVSIDIIQSLVMLKKNGIMVCDDVIKNRFQYTNASNESFKTLEFLKKKNIISSRYLVKRITRSNSDIKKFISISKKSNNNDLPRNS